ncbi:MAG: substrate-binding domain-containing protein [Sulfuricaulis sp.]|nr:substrate-binding domain-containing protein [Sulfuricaulis sp.]
MNVKRVWRHAVRHHRACTFALALALLPGYSGSADADELKIGGTGAALGTMRLLADAFRVKNPEVRIVMVPSLGSGGGIKAVAGGAIGLAVTSRPMNENESKLGITQIEYGRTPFVFAVSTKSRVTAITRGELAGIYAGKMVKWPDGTPVRIVLRPVSDIDTDIIRNISPETRQGLTAAEKRPGVQFSVNDQDAADDLEKIPGAIGPTSLALILSEKRALRALKLDGKEPTPGNAASGAYPYYKRLFLTTAAKRPAAVERFIAFVQSPAGRKILAGNGHWISAGGP